MTITFRSPNEAEIKQKDAVMRGLESDRISLLMNQPFIGSIIMSMDIVPVCDSRLKTACTDGTRIFVNTEFYASLEKKFRMTVLAHEVWHTVYCHFLRKQNREHERFNYAADLEIYFLFESENLPQFYVLQHEEKWKGLSAEEIYERLPQNILGNKVSDHVYPNETESGSPEIEEIKSNGQTDIVIDYDYAPFFTSDIKERCKERLITAVQQTERNQGHIPGCIERLVKKYLYPEIPWQELLRQFVCSCLGGKRRWLPPNRRYVSQGLYLQSRREERLPTTVVAIDTSGSMQREIPRFFAELNSLMHSFGSYELIVIQCDAAIQNVETFDENDMPENIPWKIHGCGGTDFRPVFQYVTEYALTPTVLIYITDGFGCAPKEAPDYPVLWLLTKNANPAFCSWGNKIAFNSKPMEKSKNG